MGLRFNVDGSPADIIADIVTSADTTRVLLDVGITAAAVTSRHIARGPWPTEAEVVAAVDQDEVEALVADTSKPAWKNRLHPSRLVRQQSKFRELVLRKSLEKVVANMCSEKINHYKAGHLTVVPFVLTAQGYLSKYATEFVDTLSTSYSSSVADQQWFRSSLLGRISVLLIRSACRMCIRQAEFAAQT